MGHRLSNGSDEKFNLRTLNKNAIRLLQKHLKDHQTLLWLAIALTLLISGANVVLPLLTKTALDEHIVTQQWTGLLFVVLVYIGIALLQWIASYWQTFITRKVAYQVITTLRREIYDHLVHMDIAFHNNSKVGDISSAIMNDVETLSNLISQGFVYFISDMITVIAIAVSLFLLNRQLASILLITIPVVILSTRLIGKLLRKAQRDVRKNVAQLTSGVEQNISGVKAVKTFSQEERQAKKVESLSQAARKAHVKSVTISALLFPIMDLSSAIGLGLVIWQGGLLYTQKVISLGILMASISYVRRVFGPLMDISQIYTTYQTAAAALDRIYHFLKLEPALTYPQKSAHNAEQHALTLTDLTFGYHADKPILDNASLTLRAGDKVGIVGPSGVGKSTLIKLISRLYDPQAGAVMIGNINLKQFSQKDLKHIIQVIPQDTYLFPVTVWQNIAYGLPKIKKENVVSMVEKLGLTNFFARLEQGLDTPVGEGGKTLSGGQRQAVAIARALLRDPEIIILDEAASNLDPQIENVIFNRLKSMWNHKTLIVITHRTTSLKLVDRIFEIKDKQLIPIDLESVELAGWTKQANA